MANEIKPGLWLTNGYNAPDVEKMLAWQPSTVTSIYEYIGGNNLLAYKKSNPDAQVIIRFMHPKNWMQDISISAENWAKEIVGKWQTDPVLRDLDPLIYVANEQNLWYESGGNNNDEQWSYFDTEPFYEKLGQWWADVHERIKNACPDIRLVSPPLAYGHNEDGVWKDGDVSIGWSGYDYLQQTIRDYCDGNMAAHFYWGGEWGCTPEWLYGSDADPDLATWHAFRWKRVLELFEQRYGWTPKMWIDEAGNFDAGADDFTEQLVYYAENTLSDNRIGGLTYFLWSDPTGCSGNQLNDWHRHCKDLDTHLATMGNTIVSISGPVFEPEPTPIPEPIPTPASEPEPTPDPDPEPEPEPELGIDKAEVVAARWNSEEATRELETASDLIASAISRIAGAIEALYEIENSIED